MWTGIIFDLDGTLVDSRLDHVAIRRDMGMEGNDRILETLELMEDASERVRLEAILHGHEMAGAECATLMPGVREFLEAAARRSWRTAVFTRNSRPVTDRTLARLNLAFDLVITREDTSVPKPDPGGLLEICRRWSCHPSEALYVGDYLFDLEAGRRAGMTTLLYAPTKPDFEHDAVHVIEHFLEIIALTDSGRL